MQRPMPCWLLFHYSTPASSGCGKSSAWHTIPRSVDIGDRTEIRKVAVEYPIGHRRHRHGGIPLFEGEIPQEPGTTLSEGETRGDLRAVPGSAATGSDPGQRIRPYVLDLKIKFIPPEPAIQNFHPCIPP